MESLSEYVSFDRGLLNTVSKKISTPLEPVDKAIVANNVDGGVITDQEKDEKVKQREQPLSTIRKKAAPRTDKKDKAKVVDVSFVRGFPKSALRVARSMFPDANQTDALAAFVAVHADEPIHDLPESVQLLVDEWEKTDPIKTVAKRLDLIERQLVSATALLSELELALCYLTFDKLGYRNEVAAKPGAVNFLENGVSELSDRLRMQSKQVRLQANIKKGRPIR